MQLVTTWNKCFLRAQFRVKELFFSTCNRLMATEALSSVDVVKTSENTDDTGCERTPKKKQKRPRDFDWSLWNTRHVVFKVAYLGWNYSGLQIQKDTPETIEARLLEALTKTKLVQDYYSCNLSRSGRTDAGVSALCQVIALDVRSNLLEGEGVIVKEESRANERKGDKSTEINYMFILNKVLPDDIKIIGYSHVNRDFSARFNCLQRVYKYFFPCGTLNIKAMETAAVKFIGEHDFRNFCKMDIGGGVTHFIRSIANFTIKPLLDSPQSSSFSPYQMCEVTVTGRGFLWHQVRCMVSILFLIGSGLEKPEIIDELLDIEKYPAKPNYGMAPDYPLILFDCMFEDIQWQTDEDAHKQMVSHFQQLWTKKMIQATMIKRMIDGIQLPAVLSDNGIHEVINDQTKELVYPSQQALGKQGYKPLLTRCTNDTFEERFEAHQAKKRRIMEDSSDST